ncbi:hypothetical protein WJX79_006286 [Trebouxia sp. C0005]
MRQAHHRVSNKGKHKIKAGLRAVVADVTVTEASEPCAPSQGLRTAWSVEVSQASMSNCFRSAHVNGGEACTTNL